MCGMLTYMSVLKENGTLAFLGDAAASLNSPLLTALILCFAVAAVSAVGSSISTLGIVLPLAAPLLMMGQVGLIGFVAAVSFSAVIVDVSPLSSNGVMVLANAQVPDRDKFQRSLFKYTGYIVLVAPNPGLALGRSPHVNLGMSRGRTPTGWRNCGAIQIGTMTRNGNTTAKHCSRQAGALAAELFLQQQQRRRRHRRKCRVSDRATCRSCLAGGSLVVLRNVIWLESQFPGVSSDFTLSALTAS